MSDIYVATKAFSAIVDGRRRPIRRGDHVREGHPLLRGNEHMFTPLRVEYDVEGGDVEQATAAPGEKRASRSASRSKQKQSDQDDD